MKSFYTIFVWCRTMWWSYSQISVLQPLSTKLSYITFCNSTLRAHLVFCLSLLHFFSKSHEEKRTRWSTWLMKPFVLYLFVKFKNFLIATIYCFQRRVNLKARSSITFCANAIFNFNPQLVFTNDSIICFQ